MQSLPRIGEDEDDLRDREAEAESVTETDALVTSDPLAPRWSFDDFDIGRRLGEGQFGSAYLARERRTGLLVALKAIRKSQLLSTYNEHLLRREIEIHSHLIHSNILGFYGWFVTDAYIILILELGPRGELMDRLGTGGLPEPTVSRYLMQMISAIRCCHRWNVMHRDLKPENILVDIHGNLKLADFGWAAHVPEDITRPTVKPTPPHSQGGSQQQGCLSFQYLKNRRKTYCGTLDYLSPEICRHEWYGKEVDLWCLGILCYELATGGPPFSHDNYIAKGHSEEEARRLQQSDIQNSDIKSRLKSTMSLELRDFLCSSLAKDPALRMNTTQMLKHPFIIKYNDISGELKFDDTVATRPTTKPSRQQQVATPAPGLSNFDSSIPQWHVSRHFLSAASSPNSGAVGTGASSPFPYIQAAGSAMRHEIFAPSAGRSGLALFRQG